MGRVPPTLWIELQKFIFNGRTWPKCTVKPAFFISTDHRAGELLPNPQIKAKQAVDILKQEMASSAVIIEWVSFQFAGTCSRRVTRLS